MSYGIAWTAKEDAFLAAVLNVMSNAEIGKAIGRSRSAVSNHIHLLDLQRDPAVSIAQMIANRRKGGARAARKNSAADKIPWPKVTTDIATALASKTYGGNVKEPGTRNPKYIAAVRTFQGSGAGCSLA